MVSVLIYIIIAIVAIYNGVKNYQKEQAKNKKRADEINKQTNPTIRPFQKKSISINIPTIASENSKSESNSHPSYDLNQDRNLYKNSNTYKEDSFHQQENLYNSKDIESIIARIESYSDTNEKQAFMLESDNVSNTNNTTSNLGLNSPEDYRRAFIHTLIFEKKY